MFPHPHPYTPVWPLARFLSLNTTVPFFFFLHRNFEESLFVVESPTTLELTGGVSHFTNS